MPDFFSSPILNSPYLPPERHWELDEKGQPTDKIISGRRLASFITPIARSKRVSTIVVQSTLDLDDVISEDGQEYSKSYSWINKIRESVSQWRSLPECKWDVTPETARLLRHWRTFNFSNQRPFFCQIEAVEVLIWLTEVAPKYKDGKEILNYIKRGNDDANPNLYRIALKLATGAGKTTVMAMIIAWQTINAVRYPASKIFTKGFLIVAPGLTIKDRLRVLQPNDPDAYYLNREIIPQDFKNEINKARIVITNYHAFKLKEKIEIAKGTRNLLKGCHREEISTTETKGQMLQRVIPELLGMKNIMVINDEAHHCYREKPLNDEEDKKLSADEKAEIGERREMARLWISGLEAVKEKIGCKVIDLSATPFFLRGSGYEEGTLFPWTVSDFSLMDAIECGIVKLPRVPVADNNPHVGKGPMFRNLRGEIGKKMPKKNRTNGGVLDPANLPSELITAIDALYGHYEKTYKLWQEAQMDIPPCFIFVCQNTAISKLVFDYISGYKLDDKSSFHAAHCPLFSNYDEYGNLLSIPNTILVDSIELESGEALSKDFQTVASAEIDKFKREIIERTGSRIAAENLSDSDLLREVMNTVGKSGKLGGNIRCVVSVSMLTEGWDANNVTHILGLRAFGTQLICEQVVGRALRRSNYELNEDGKFNAEYADIFGIPFDFTGKSTPSIPTPPKKLTLIKSLSPERDCSEIKFPNIDGYRVELSSEKLSAKWTAESDFTISPDIVGPCETRNEPIVGEGVNFTVKHLQDVRANTIIYNLTVRLIDRHFRDAGQEPKLHLFGELKPIVADWVRNHLHCVGQSFPAQILYDSLAETACNRITQAIVSTQTNETPVAIVNPYNPYGSTANVHFATSKTELWKSDSKNHINYVVLDSEWEGEMCRVLESNPHVVAYTKNHNLGFRIPYFKGNEASIYVPDFIVRIDNGVNLILETKGFKNEAVNDKKSTIESYWIPAVNKLGTYGKWSFAQFEELFQIEAEFEKLIERELKKNK